MLFSRLRVGNERHFQLRIISTDNKLIRMKSYCNPTYMHTYIHTFRYLGIVWMMGLHQPDSLSSQFRRESVGLQSPSVTLDILDACSSFRHWDIFVL